MRIGYLAAVGAAAAVVGAFSGPAGAQGSPDATVARSGEKIVSNGRGLWVVRRSGRRKLPRDWSIEAMSPDGRQSHFKTYGNGKIFLRVVNRRGHVRTLATWPRRCGLGTPDWSPDSTQIVFSRDPLPCPKEHSGLAELVVMSAAGGAPRTLVLPPEPTRLFQFGVPFWGPSGIAMGASISVNEAYEGRTGVWLFNPDGSTPPRLLVDSFRFTASRSPGRGSAYAYPYEWSPDGRTLAVDVTISRTTRSAMYAYDVQTGDVKRLFGIPGISPEDISWSPNSRRLVYTQPTSLQRSVIRVVNRDGSGLRTLTRPPRRLADVSPVWSPDGRRMAFRRFGHTPLGRRTPEQIRRWQRFSRPRWLVVRAKGGKPRPLKLRGLRRKDELLAWR